MAGHNVYAFNPEGLPSALPTFTSAQKAKKQPHEKKVQSSLLAVLHHMAWRVLHHEFLSHTGAWDNDQPWTTLDGNREACRLISCSGPNAYHAWEAVPTCQAFRISSRTLLVATQRRLGLPLTTSSILLENPR